MAFVLFILTSSYPFVFFAEVINTDSVCDASKYDPSLKYTQVNSRTGKRGLINMPCSRTSSTLNITISGYCVGAGRCSENLFVTPEGAKHPINQKPFQLGLSNEGGQAPEPDSIPYGSEGNSLPIHAFDPEQPLNTSAAQPKEKGFFERLFSDTPENAGTSGIPPIRPDLPGLEKRTLEPSSNKNAGGVPMETNSRLPGVNEGSTFMKPGEALESMKDAKLQEQLLREEKQRNRVDKWGKLGNAANAWENASRNARIAFERDMRSLQQAVKTAPVQANKFIMKFGIPVDIGFRVWQRSVPPSNNTY